MSELSAAPASASPRAIAAWAPWSPSWNSARALSACERGDWARAEEWLDASLRRGQNPIWVAETKTLVHWQAGKAGQLEADLEALRKLDAKRAEKLAREIKGPKQ
jgi:hypothetical protein